jgi:hypothetical protein
MLRSVSTIVEVPGRVQVWSYTVGHGQLLLRRPKSDHHPRRIDILFKAVSEVHLASSFDNLRVLEVSLDDIPARMTRDGASSLRRAFKLVADNATGFVIAATVVHAEDDLEYHDPSPFQGSLQPGWGA